MIAPAPARRSRRCAGRGFTLLELLVVLVILAAALAVTLPALSRTAPAEARAAARTVAAAARRVRETAVRTGRPAALTLDVERRELALPGEPRPRRLPSQLGLGLFTARSEILGEGRGAIRFFPDGSATGGRVSVELSASDALLVDVDWLTGAVRISRGSPEDLAAGLDLPGARRVGRGGER